MNGIEAVILDTNAVIEMLNNKFTAVVFEKYFSNTAVCISVITQIELLGYPDISDDEEIKIKNFLSDISIINIDDIIIEIAISIKRNKHKKIKLPDAIVAATAIALNAALITKDNDLLKLKYDKLRTWTF
ncbi:MAG: hypothetical protein Pg6A_03520 [Termitinemataceae bacterium]|nr:MAG: hypothetical protein Pg6A_03520 [Termitinemataceae bacterium]